jgi:hypothetical protein
MNYFVRFAKAFPSGAIAPPGWRVRLFATSNEAGAFAQEMIGKGCRAELGNFGEPAAGAPSPKTAERSFIDELIEWLERAASVFLLCLTQMLCLVQSRAR